MKKNKATRAMAHMDDDLIAGAIRESDLRGESTKKKIGWRKWIAIAAAFALMISGGVMFARLAGSAAPGAVIALDVNPSIEFTVDGKENVTAVSALNTEAEEVLSELELHKVNLKTALYAVIGSMLEHGYLSSEQNSILISVDAKDAQTATALREKLSAEVGALLGNRQIEASVITQSFEKDGAGEKAEENHISPAKAALIEKIVAAGLLDSRGVPYTYEVLASLKVNDLKLILETKDLTVDGIVASGEAGGGAYITREEALSIALEKAGLTEVAQQKIEMDYDDDYRKMVYEIEFFDGESEYDYEIDAVSGQILDEERKPLDRDDGDDLPPQAGTYLPREEALSLAYADAGLSQDAVRRPEIELESERGRAVYEIEFKANGMEYEYILDAETGEILHKESERDD